MRFIVAVRPVLENRKKIVRKSFKLIASTSVTLNDIQDTLWSFYSASA